MQFSQKTFGSQNAMKQLYRQYSTTFKNTQTDNKNKGMMTHSIDVGFNKIYNAFNSSSNIQNMQNPLQRFKNSEVKSIIEKLMQPREGMNAGGLAKGFGLGVISNDQEVNLLNDLNLQGLASSSSNKHSLLPLSQTQKKIYFEIINLITQINEINTTAEKQNEQFLTIKQQLKKQGVDFPQVQQKKKASQQNIILQFTKQQLQNMFQQNENLQKQIQKLTKQLASHNQSNQHNRQINQLISLNTHLSKQLSAVKTQIFNSGQFDQQQIAQLKAKINVLQTDIYNLQQKRLGRFNQKDEEWIFLKGQNERLRQKTLELLRNQQDNMEARSKYSSSNNRNSSRKAELIEILRREEENKIVYAEEIEVLKHKYEQLLEKNEELKRNNSSQSLGGPSSLARYDYPLQVQSKVRPFQNTYGDYRNSLGSGKQNYLQNYQPQRNRNSFKQKSNPYSITQFDQNYRPTDTSRSNFRSNQYISNSYLNIKNPSVDIVASNNSLNEYEQFTNQMKKYYS